MNAEILDVYNSQGENTGQIKSKDDTFHENEYRLMASLWIINANGEALIQRRASTKKVCPNMWNITGGHVQAGENSIEACIREVAEEIGLHFKPQDITLLSRSFGDGAIFDDYITVCNCKISDFVLQPEEVSEIGWASLAEIKALFHAGAFMFSNIDKLEKVAAYINKLVDL